MPLRGQRFSDAVVAAAGPGAPRPAASLQPAPAAPSRSDGPRPAHGGFREALAAHLGALEEQLAREHEAALGRARLEASGGARPGDGPELSLLREQLAAARAEAEALRAALVRRTAAHEAEVERLRGDLQAARRGAAADLATEDAPREPDDLGSPSFEDSAHGFAGAVFGEALVSSGGVGEAELAAALAPLGGEPAAGFGPSLAALVPGQRCAARGGTVTAGEDPGSAGAGQLEPGAVVEVLEVGAPGPGGRVRVRTERGLEGWASAVSKDGAELLTPVGTVADLLGSLGMDEDPGAAPRPQAEASDVSRGARRQPRASAWQRHVAQAGAGGTR